MTYLNHLTLTTGHLRRSRPDEVDNGVVAAVRDLLADSMTGNSRVPLPVPGYHIYAESYGRRAAMRATVYDPDGLTLVTIGVAARPAKALWRDLTIAQYRADPLVTAGQEPQSPWCTAILWPALALDGGGAASWLGDFERCAAWAWLS